MQTKVKSSIPFWAISFGTIPDKPSQQRVRASEIHDGTVHQLTLRRLIVEAQDKDPLLGYSCIYEIDRQEMKTLVGGIDLKIPGQNPSFDTERLLKKLGLIGPMYV